MSFQLHKTIFTQSIYRSRTAKVTRRSHTHRERRRKDLTAGIPKEESNLPKQVVSLLSATKAIDCCS